MRALVILILAVNQNGNGYILGALIAFLVLGYLIYSLLKPEKF